MKITIGDFIIKRLEEIGINHIIGVPGDYTLQFLEQIRKNGSIEFVGASNELNAAYAADGYARVNGISALSLTYGVGDLGGILGVAGSYAEHVPVIVISGAPPLYAIEHNFRVHHSLGDGNFTNMRHTYEEFTIDSSMITPDNAEEEIDRLIRLAMVHKRPVNIQVPSNISYLEIEVEDGPLKIKEPVSDSERLKSLTDQIIALYKKSIKPHVLIDLDIDRLEIKDKILELIENAQIPFAAMSTGKAILDENHPLYIGIYKGNESEEGVQEAIEHSDFLLTVSPRFIEWNSGTYSQNLPLESLVRLDLNHTFVRDQCYEAVYIKDIINVLLEKIEKNPDKKNLNDRKVEEFKVEKSKKLNQESFWKQVHPFLQEGDLIYGETGSSLKALGAMLMPKDATFISSQIWGAIGYLLPALFGSLLARPNRRQLLFIGDGSFQVTAQSLSRILYNNLNPIIFIINNDGYTIERYIMGMKADYSVLPRWKYSKLPDVLVEKNKMKTYNVHTQGELAKALEAAQDISNGILIEVHLHPEDAPEPLKVFGPEVAKFNFGPRGPKNEKPEFNPDDDNISNREDGKYAKEKDKSNEKEKKDKKFEKKYKQNKKGTGKKGNKKTEKKRKK
ncbi:alpha-keto acid decarboxylase family protein [Peptostreptococcus equinus]|uniref:Alpha-keto-acid decarboxylase n=1 Tax=Peptostreptococcus equinus TaxID=3003601 RepID=A0ABY7JMH0_9FIRM|nr:thiamine pyrophosphate-binding protein [Peptostreptococcus sp. CBA3647]WAW14359.1 thiamine pyrophosphate-binding protein [Peptostreptococcus sp. CBA3647]